MALSEKEKALAKTSGFFGLWSWGSKQEGL